MISPKSSDDFDHGFLKFTQKERVRVRPTPATTTQFPTSRFERVYVVRRPVVCSDLHASEIVIVGNGIGFYLWPKVGSGSLLATLDRKIWTSERTKVVYV